MEGEHCAQVGDYPATRLFNTSKWFANVPAVVVAALPDEPKVAPGPSAWVMRLSTPVFNGSAVPSLTFLANPVTSAAAVDVAAAPLRKGGLAETYLNNGTAGVSAVGAWPDLTTPLFLSNITVFMEVRAQGFLWPSPWHDRRERALRMARPDHAAVPVQHYGLHGGPDR